MKTLVVIGATSSIARAFAAGMASDGWALHLVARDTAELERIASDLRIRYGTKVTTTTLDVDKIDDHARIFANCKQEHGSFQGVLLAVGELGDHQSAEHDVHQAATIATRNFTAPMASLLLAAEGLEQAGEGFIIALSSVAGDRGRPSNYIYGSSKGGLTLFLQGLRARMAKKGVHVMTAKLGFVDTKMTFGKAGMFLVAQPEAIAQMLMKALKQKKDSVYLPWFWAYIMLIIKSIPEPIFKRMKL